MNLNIYVQGSLLYQISLMLVQKFAYGYYSHHGSNYVNQIENPKHRPMHHQTHYEIYNSPINFRRQEDDINSEDSEECICSCNECANPKPCCAKYCKICSLSADYTDSNTQQSPYLNQPDPNIIVIPYPVPILIFPIKTVKSMKNSNDSINIESNQTTSEPTTTTVQTKPTAAIEETAKDGHKSEEIENSKNVETAEEMVSDITEDLLKEDENVSNEDVTQSVVNENPGKTSESPPEEAKTIIEDPQEVEKDPEKNEFPSKETPSILENNDILTEEITFDSKQNLQKEVKTPTAEEIKPPQRVELSSSSSSSDVTVESIDPKPADPKPIERTRVKLPYPLPNWLRKFG